MTGDRTPWVFLKTPFNEAWGAFSPDGRWVAYQSNESGPVEIYVRPFVPPVAAGTAAGPGRTGGQWQVSTAGGVFPVWRPDGKELYYLNPEGAMMAATITVTGSTLAPGAPVVLFPTRILRRRCELRTGSVVRRGPRRPLSDQHSAGRRRGADHAADELAPAGPMNLGARACRRLGRRGLVSSAASTAVVKKLHLRRGRPAGGSATVRLRSLH